ncbi:response regulator protein [Fictibacillus macauensis ZFHKF-1]|uniref:Response regulator protein n=1 Tax=Fictibacillus macauensis ZFHKF-1 TaxID=1196324 RepID=I8IW28_9BACL|nr:response regulator transcription factor [Fictibacillus macauensis]EIT83691.1 response regulator protein [Fictibacillus macauensis ZFHKF-1]
MFSVLIADDEQPIVDVCKLYLEREGCKVFVANNGADAEQIVLTEAIDFMVLDIMMPQKDGYQLVESLNQQGYDIPFLYLTALNQEKDTLYGLTLGADDYMTKPFSPRELVLRIKNILKRSNTQSASPQAVLEEGSLYLNNEDRMAKVNGKSLDLRNKEFDLLWFLVKEKHRVISKSELLEKVWGYDYYEDANTVNVHIHHLREKLMAAADDEQIVIKTIWGLGYQFKGDGEA